eukprot:scaffold264826_cov47-Prasinocladus_malaysianus.AAC.1
MLSDLTVLASQIPQNRPIVGAVPGLIPALEDMLLGGVELNVSSEQLKGAACQLIAEVGRVPRLSAW